MGSKINMQDLEGHNHHADQGCGIHIRAWMGYKPSCVMSLQGFIPAKLGSTTNKKKKSIS